MKPQALELSRVPPAWEQGCPGTSLGRYLLLSLVFLFFLFCSVILPKFRYGIPRWSGHCTENMVLHYN